MKRLIFAFFLHFLTFSGAFAQDLSRWGDIEAFLIEALSPGEEIAAYAWLPDNPDPDLANEAIGVVYPVLVGAAGNTGIAAGHFYRFKDEMELNSLVTNLFGYDPRDARFFADRIEITTNVLGPNDPRCCPSKVQVWRLPRADFAAVQVP
ncbi:MAG: hypothetical protein KDE08_17100 [Rhodobacteraceae bacterium]|nr:hypothetical protein [Paracoccaceae bacterium]